MSETFNTCVRTFITLSSDNKVDVNTSVFQWVDKNASISLNPDEYDNFSLHQLSVCLPASYIDELQFSNKINFIFWALSIFFMVLTMAVNLLPPTRSKNLTLVLQCHLATMILTYVSYFLHYVNPRPTWEHCVALNASNRFLSISAMAWLTVLVFRLWKKFGNPSSRMVYTHSKSKWKTLLCQAGYAWGMPLVLVAVAAVLDVTNHLPAIYREFCWTRQSYANYAFSYAPLFAVLLLNLTFYVLTVIRNRNYARDIGMVNSRATIQLWRAFGKIILILGFLYVLDLSLIIWGQVNASQLQHHSWVLPTVSAIDNLQGIAMCVVYVCRESVWRELRRRLPCCPTLLPETTTGTVATSLNSIYSTHM